MAQELIKMSKEENAIFLFIGRTPLWIMHAVNIICDNNGLSKENFIPINFSGTPDINIERRELLNPLEYNIVTPKRLDVFETYLEKSGLDNSTSKKRIYLIDLFGSGASLNSFIRILRHHYTVRLKVNFPDVTFLAINLSRENEFIKLTKMVNTPSYLKLNWLPGKNIGKVTYNPDATYQRNGMSSFQIDIIPFDFGDPLRRFEKASDLLDSGMKPHWSSANEFYACQWNEQNLANSNVGPKNLFTEIYRSYFRPAIERLICQDFKSCYYCHKHAEKLLVCSSCHKVKYCNRECQKKDWAEHKKNCK